VASTASRTIGSFEVEGEIARGGMGVVYRAHQPLLERPAVLKTLRRELADDRALGERFRREAQAAASVHHENVVAVYDGFTFRGRSYIAQEFVDGEDLATAIRATERLPARIAAMIFLDIARGLEAIHAGGIVHRDLKPSNVMLTRCGRAKVADFGIALGRNGPALTQTGHAVGTPRYMSPEQLYGERVDPRSDLFAAGVVLYEMLAGRPPFAESCEEDDDALVRRIESGRFPSIRKLAPRTPRWLARLVHRCLRSRPRKRPASATVVRERLERALGESAVRERHAIVAEWMWNHDVFPKLKDETAPSPVRSRRVGPQALRAAAVAAAIGAALLSWAWALERLGVDLPLPAWAEGAKLPWEQVASRSTAFLDARVGSGVEP